MSASESDAPAPDGWVGPRLIHGTAMWSNLFLATYAVPPELLRPWLSPEAELELWNGEALASLVALDLLDYQVFGVPLPVDGSYAELNLRFYVRSGDQNGVGFVQELEPFGLVAWMMNGVLNQPYVTAPIETTVDEDDRTVTVRREGSYGGSNFSLWVSGHKPATLPQEGTVERFLTDRRWMYYVDRDGRPAHNLEVVHPTWAAYELTDYVIDLDWAALYGPEWGVMNGATPRYITFCAGSPTEMYLHAKPLF